MGFDGQMTKHGKFLHGLKQLVKSSQHALPLGLEQIWQYMVALVVVMSAYDQTVAFDVRLLSAQQWWLGLLLPFSVFVAISLFSMHHKRPVGRRIVTGLVATLNLLAFALLNASKWGLFVNLPWISLPALSIIFISCRIVGVFTGILLHCMCPRNKASRQQTTLQGAASTVRVASKQFQHPLPLCLEMFLSLFLEGFALTGVDWTRYPAVVLSACGVLAVLSFVGSFVLLLKRKGKVYASVAGFIAVCLFVVFALYTIGVSLFAFSNDVSFILFCATGAEHGAVAVVSLLLQWTDRQARTQSELDTQREEYLSLRWDERRLPQEASIQ